MPEWPDLHVLRQRLDEALAGRRLIALSHRGKFLTGYLETNFCPTCQPAPPGQIY